MSIPGEVERYGGQCLLWLVVIAVAVALLAVLWFALFRGRV